MNSNESEINMLKEGCLLLIYKMNTMRVLLLFSRWRMLKMMSRNHLEWKIDGGSDASESDNEEVGEVGNAIVAGVDVSTSPNPISIFNAKNCGYYCARNKP